MKLTPVTLEQDVKAALSKVKLGEVDAALVYRTDAKAAAADVDGVEFPESAGAINDYPIVVLKNAPEQGRRAGVRRLRAVRQGQGGAHRGRLPGAVTDAVGDDRAGGGAATPAAPVAARPGGAARAGRGSAWRSWSCRWPACSSARRGRRCRSGWPSRACSPRCGCRCRPPPSPPLLCLVLGVPLAWLLARVEFPGRRLVRALVTVPLVLPPVVGGVALLLVFGRRGPGRRVARRHVRHHAAVHHHRRRARRGVRRHAVPRHRRRGRAARRRRPLRGGRRHPRRRPLDHVPPRHPAAGRARHRGRRGAVLGPGAGRVRRHHHLRRQLPRPHPDHAARRLPRPGDRPRGRDRAQPHPARRLRRHPGQPARPWITSP